MHLHLRDKALVQRQVFLIESFPIHFSSTYSGITNYTSSIATYQKQSREVNVTRINWYLIETTARRNA